MKENKLRQSTDAKGRQLYRTSITTVFNGRSLWQHVKPYFVPHHECTKVDVVDELAKWTARSPHVEVLSRLQEHVHAIASELHVKKGYVHLVLIAPRP